MAGYVSHMSNLVPAVAFAALAAALGPCPLIAQGISKYADPNWNPNMETNKVSSLAGKAFGGGKANLADRSARMGDGDVKLKTFPVKQWASPEATGIDGRPAKLRANEPPPIKSSPYATKSFTPGRGGETTRLQKSYPVEKSKFSGRGADGFDTDTASKAYADRSAADLQATIDRTLTKTLTMEEVKKLLNEPGSSPEPTAEVKSPETSLPGQGQGILPGAGIGTDPRAQRKPGHRLPARR